MPVYDGGTYLWEGLEGDPSTTNLRRVFRSCTWVGSSVTSADFPMLPVEQGLVPNDVRIKLRVAKPYEKYSATEYNVENVETATNHWNPRYTFSTHGVATKVGNTATLSEVLDEINVVPNPYYAYSQYETSKLDNRIKITNLPEKCQIRIYSSNGKLIRNIKKDSPITFQDWDLTNHAGIPVASGIYLIHVEVPNVGERVLKAFIAMRMVDLQNI
jgi:hypothetical protein